MDYHKIPSIFQSRNLRSGERFSNLRSHKFSIAEKQWLCNLLMSQQEHHEEQSTMLLCICTRYDISKLVINEQWLCGYKLGHKLKDGFCIPDDEPVDSFGLEAILKYNSDKQNENESDEIQANRFANFMELQLLATIARRQDALNLEVQELMSIAFIKD